jgi:N-acetylglucosaminyldiphosphoundecaprenol N-acetyl-beta-D-mannosaminyltransferase
MKRIQFFSCPMDLATMNETVHAIVERVEARKFTQHVVVNVAKLVNLQADRELAESVCACDFINIDGMGVVWGARFLGYDVPERVSGIDLFQRLLEISSEKGFSVYLLGGTQSVIEETASRLQSNFPKLRIAGHHHGYFWKDEEHIVEEIKKSGAQLLFVAISSPKKESFINKWKNDLGVNFAMGVGGTFDIVAGKVQRAPEWMQRSGLEWAFRVIQEPKRMWRRYFSTNFVFAWMLVKEFGRLRFGR